MMHLPSYSKVFIALVTVASYGSVVLMPSTVQALSQPVIPVTVQPLVSPLPASSQRQAAPATNADQTTTPQTSQYPQPSAPATTAHASSETPVNQPSVQSSENRAALSNSSAPLTSTVAAIGTPTISNVQPADRSDVASIYASGMPHSGFPALSSSQVSTGTLVASGSVVLGLVMLILGKSNGAYSLRSLMIGSMR